MSEKHVVETVETENDIVEMLSKIYTAPAWAFLPQVRNQTGYSNQIRTADAIAMSLWPSRGLHLNGFEIKVNRNDWLNELKNPEKAEMIASYCDFWWVVASDGIVKIEEVPANWGHIVSNGKKLKTIKVAPIKKSEPINKSFLAAILRKTQETITPEAKIKEAFNNGVKKGKEEAESLRKYEHERYSELQKVVFEFEKKSGVKIDTWNHDNVGEAVRMVLNGEHLMAKKQLERLLETSKDITKSIEEHLGKSTGSTP